MATLNPTTLNSDFTPGPWHCADADEPDYLLLYASTRHEVALVPDFDAEGEYNAQLIAAAPALYESAKLALLWFDKHPDLIDTATDDGVRDELSAALALVDAEAN